MPADQSPARRRADAIHARGDDLARAERAIVVALAVEFGVGTFSESRAAPDGPKIIVGDGYLLTLEPFHPDARKMPS